MLLDRYQDVKWDREPLQAVCLEEPPEKGDNGQAISGLCSPIGPVIGPRPLEMAGAGPRDLARWHMPQRVCANPLASNALNPLIGAPGAWTEGGSAEPASLVLRHDSFARASDGGTSLSMGNGTAEVGTHA